MRKLHREAACRLSQLMHSKREIELEFKRVTRETKYAYKIFLMKSCARKITLKGRTTRT